MPVCRECGQENPEGFRLCGMCGAPLAAVAPADAEERKLVSVLFVDLVGHTATSDRADPEDVRARLRPYHQLLKREIERFGGTVEKFIGDAVMAVFGAPIAHEDDAERAARSGLRILEQVGELGVEVRAAVATGEAVVSLAARPEQGEGIVTGDVVNTASRLQQAAPAGSLVAGEVTYRATRDAIEYEQLDPVTVKGKAEPLPLWRALNARARFGVDVEAPRTPFVGREHDLTLLQNTYERTLRERSVQLVTVVGEPGVGKTRLLSELRSWVDDRPELVRWRQGRCLPYGEGITFWALGEVVKAEAGIRETDPAEAALAKLDAAVAALIEQTSEREWLVGRLAPLVGAAGSSGTVDRSESFMAWRRFLEELADQRPLLMVVEDLHWADDPLFAFLDHLSDRAVGVPLLVLCSARPELYERQPEWGGGKRNSTTLALSPLTGKETARLIATLLDKTVLPAETQTALLDRAGGNPLYAEEFVRMLTDRSLLTPDGGLAEDAEIAVPETLQALIAARLDTLAPERKAVLHAASVVGKVFWPSAVAAVGDLRRDDVEQGLSELLRKELVRPGRQSSLEGEDEFSFWHLLVRDVAYGQIPRAARARRHRAAAEWIEEVAGERVADHAEVLAEHYREALELSRAAGPANEAADLEAKAAHFLTLAGDRAFHLDAPRAEFYYRAARSLVEPRTRAQALLLLKLANVGRIKPEARELTEEAVGIFRELGDETGAAGALSFLAGLLWTAGQTAQSQEVLQEALSLLEGKPPSSELVAVYARLAGTAMVAGRAEDALRWTEQASPLLDEFAEATERVRLIQFRGAARSMLGDPAGLEGIREALRLGLEMGLGQETALAYTNLAGFLSDMEGPAAALEVYAEGIAFAERRGLVGMAHWARGETTWCLFDLGRWDEVVAMADDFPRDGEGQVTTIVRTELAHVLAWRGEAEVASAELSHVLPRAREIADVQILAPALIAAAELESFHGRQRAALELLVELDAAVRDKPFFRSVTLPAVSRLYRAAGEGPRLARLLADEPEPRHTRVRNGRLAAEAVLAEAQGHLDDAVRLYGEAAEAWAGFGDVVERALALLGRGRCLVDLGRARDAAANLGEARAVFARLGARWCEAEADRLISAAA